MPQVSLVLRLKNEERFLPQVLEALMRQTFKDFEVIAVLDARSNDQTRSILRDYSKKLDIRIFDLPGKFYYATACNYGAQKASGKIIGYLSGHSVPIFDNYLEEGLSHFTDAKVAGVYGPGLPLSNATFWERMYYTNGMGEQRALHNALKAGPVVFSKPRVGLLGNTNSLMRKSLWQQYHFSEEMVTGGEDVDWAFHFLKAGYAIVREPKMVIRHSHGVGLIGLIKQRIHWQEMHNKALIRNQKY